MSSNVQKVHSGLIGTKSIRLYVLSSVSSFQVSMSLVVSGPLWTGPLHDTAYITDMLTLATEWGWAGSDTGTDLDKLLNTMLAESDPRLPFGFINLDEVHTC